MRTPDGPATVYVRSFGHDIGPRRGDPVPAGRSVTRPA